MSSSTSIIYGRGFETTSLSFKTIMGFAQKHKFCFKNISHFEEIGAILSDMDINLIPDSFSTGDYEEEKCDKVLLNLISVLEDYTETHCAMSADVCANRDFANIIADIFNAENPDIRLSFQAAQPEECEGQPSIMMQEGMPWHMTEREKTLTEACFDMLLFPYLTELGLSSDDIDYLKIEYYG